MQTLDWRNAADYPIIFLRCHITKSSRMSYSGMPDHAVFGGPTRDSRGEEPTCAALLVCSSSQHPCALLVTRGHGLQDMQAKTCTTLDLGVPSNGPTFAERATLPLQLRLMADRLMFIIIFSAKRTDITNTSVPADLRSSSPV
jgi:hypothetical protein